MVVATNSFAEAIQSSATDNTGSTISANTHLPEASRVLFSESFPSPLAVM